MITNRHEESDERKHARSKIKICIIRKKWGGSLDDVENFVTKSSNGPQRRQDNHAE